MEDVPGEDTLCNECKLRVTMRAKLICIANKQNTVDRNPVTTVYVERDEDDCWYSKTSNCVGAWGRGGMLTCKDWHVRLPQRLSSGRTTILRNGSSCATSSG